MKMKLAQYEVLGEGGSDRPVPPGTIDCLLKSV